MAWKVQKRQVLDTQVSSATSYHHGEVSLVKVGGCFLWLDRCGGRLERVKLTWNMLDYFGTPKSWRWFGIGSDDFPSKMKSFKVF